ncbi:betaine-aldehyde dehydrogenase [Acidiphilium acidophilum]|uniref:Betaine-aldehyde dehydrogenase n=1 Tax=Acidiphilium acidophilum TaxID=76588 RepID=A0AAW9DX71_ACIAO|nr:betaine-aldehyde dehydrogenase [Acidiphilium acidophilum]MDX5932853.1 betaine-aldehyde dehydrogenase [Acidiphilium acidophilum]
MIPRPSFIAGQDRSAPGAATFEDVNPATGAVLATLDIADAAAIDAAVIAASHAQHAWAATPAAERGRILLRTARLLRDNLDRLARLESQDTGRPISETLAVDVISGAECLEYFGGLAGTIAGEAIDLGPTAFGYTRREPIGVVAAIGAWNYPLQIACWKAAPALVCGNAVIFKPAPQTPLTALELARIFQQAGLPDGLFNVVNGLGETGRLLVEHPGIGKISLTGSVATGKAVAALAAASLKRVTLELGGKSPIIICDDADIDSAVNAAMLGNFYSAGEICSNGTRVFVHRSIHDRFLAALVEKTRSLVIGDPLDPATQIGALISPEHMNKVLTHIEAGKAAGARLVTGGQRRTTGSLAHGNFVEPTIFADCTDTMSIAQEEIFGPVMAVFAFETDAEATARANATPYGLSAAVFTTTLARAHTMIALLKAGTCWINQYNITPVELPFGGMKQSGYGRENSRTALDAYTETKSVYVALTPVVGF